MTEQEKYMQRCLALALKAEGETFPNPMVGCVIVHNGKIIGEGYHKKAGEPHAEINAINSVENPALLPDSEIFVSLEPCSHFGRTPPCANRLVEVGFKKVIIGARDSNKAVNGGGIKILKDAGIAVETGILEQECREINRRFFTFHEKKRPYIILKWAESADRFLDKNFHPTQIGNALTKQFVHHLRAKEHGILVGTTTVINDNPTLTTREVFGINPTRIVIDFDLKIPENFKIFNDETETIIINSEVEKTAGNIDFIRALRENSVRGILGVLHQKNIQSVLVEGGRKTLQKFIDTGFWDEAVIIKNPKLFCGNGTEAPKLSEKNLEKLENFDGNLIEFYTNKNSESLV